MRSYFRTEAPTIFVKKTSAYNPVNTTRRFRHFLEQIYSTSGKEFQVAVEILFQVSVVFEARTIRCGMYFRNSSLPVGLTQKALCIYQYLGIITYTVPCPSKT